VPRLSAEEARRRFAHAQVARLATVGPGAVPHLVPVVFAVDGDEICTVVDAKPKAGGVLARLRNVTERPAVSLLASGGSGPMASGGSWSPARSVSGPFTCSRPATRSTPPSRVASGPP